jgi:hypothetical protein
MRPKLFVLLGTLILWFGKLIGNRTGSISRFLFDHVRPNVRAARKARKER